MRRRTPHWFQDRLTRIGGRNPHGDPRFKLVWGESESMRDGGYFMKDGYEGYRDVPALGLEKAWVLMMWEPAAKCGSPWRWYKDHMQTESGLVTLGQYPHHGRYRVIRKLIHREFINGELHVWRMEPTHFILDVMLPMIKNWNQMANEQRLAIIEEERIADEAKADRILEDSRKSHKINRNSPLVQKRLELMERTMHVAMAMAAKTQAGMHQIGA
jgi:hypothetical protein